MALPLGLERAAEAYSGLSIETNTEIVIYRKRVKMEERKNNVRDDNNRIEVSETFV